MTDVIGRRIFMTPFQAAMKAFYVKRVAEDRTHTESVDLAMRVVGDRRRVDADRRRRAVRGLQGEQARTDALQVVHGPAQVRSRTGSGLGTDRCAVSLLWEDHIRNFCIDQPNIDCCEPSYRFPGNHSTLRSVDALSKMSSTT